MTLDLLNRYARTPATTGDESLRDLGIDDADKIGIAMAIEEEIGGAIPDMEIVAWHSAACVRKTVERVCKGIAA